MFGIAQFYFQFILRHIFLKSGQRSCTFRVLTTIVDNIILTTICNISGSFNPISFEIFLWDPSFTILTSLVVNSGVYIDGSDDGDDGYNNF